MNDQKKFNSFCETKPSTCTMNYCDENGCQDRQRNIVDVSIHLDIEEENERLKTELAEVKRFLQELYHSGKVPELWRVRMERFVK